MRNDVGTENIPVYCVSAADASCTEACIIVIIIIINVVIFAVVAAAVRTRSGRRRTLPIPPVFSSRTYYRQVRQYI